MNAQQRGHRKRAVPLLGARALLAFALAFAIIQNGLAANVNPIAAPLIPAAEIVERGVHHRVWQTVWQERVGDSTWLRTNLYTELATGMHYAPTNGAPGELRESQEVIRIVDGRGVADQGMHRASFSPSIDDTPAMIYEDPDGHRFQTRILGLAYFECSSGKSVLLCETKGSIGQIVEGQPNQVIYPDALTDGLRANVRYVFKRDSFSQDIELLAQLPSPSEWDLDPARTRLQVWTELLGEIPVPQIQHTNFIYQETDPAVLRQNLAEPHFKDIFLSYGQMQIGRGKAFSINTEAVRLAGIDVEQEVSVGKELLTINDEQTGQPRSFLVESTEWNLLEPLQATLPTAAIKRRQDGQGQFAKATKRSALPRPQFMASLPKPPRVIRPKEKIEMAAVKPARQPAVILDYTTLLTTNDYRFKSDATTFISASVNLSGANNVLEGGTVLKYAVGAQLKVTGSGAALKAEQLGFRCGFGV